MSKPVQARSLVMIQKVLDAAESLILRQGIGSLTMDAVAAEAGVSKGGIMHHFKSKDALVEALVARKLELLRNGLDRHRAELPKGGARTLSGMARYGCEQYAEDQGFPRALLVAAVENSRSLDQLKALFADTLGEVSVEGGQNELDVVLLFAVMGILLAKSLGICDLPLSQARAHFEAIAHIAAFGTANGARSATSMPRLMPRIEADLQRPIPKKRGNLRTPR